MTRAEELLRDLVRAILYEEDQREDTILLDYECGICTHGVRHLKLCPKHAAEAYCKGLKVEQERRHR